MTDLQNQPDSVASRMRSSGMARHEVVAVLKRDGHSAEDADVMLDQIDLELGTGGRSLPDDVSPAVLRQLRGDDQDSVATLPRDLSPKERQQLQHEATRMWARGKPRGSVVNFMMEGGIGEQEANGHVDRIAGRLATKRARFDSQRRVDIVVGWIQIVFGALMIPAGLALGTGIVMALGTVCAGNGLRTLRAAQQRTFVEYVSGDLRNHRS